MEGFQWGWVPPTAILILLFLGNGGYGTLIWVVVAELLPPKVEIDPGFALYHKIESFYAWKPPSHP